MCFSYSVNFKAEALQSRLNLTEAVQVPEPGFFISAFTYPIMPVVAANTRLHAENMQWGLIPEWVKTPEKAAELREYGLNAKGETLHQKPMFHHAFESHRILVPMAGFYEWREFNKKKYPYYIFPANDDFFLVAGIASHWINKETGETMGTFAVVTCPSGPLLTEIHNTKKRQPLILAPDDWQKWIFGADDQALELVKPCDDSLLKAHTIAPLASRVRENRNIPEVQQPYSYPEFSPTLF
jgi:putative SOS response-associated peptidase YedK